MNGSPNVKIETLTAGELQVDPDVQRKFDAKSKVFKNMIADWDWSACGALNVSYRDDGRFYITDGQYRWHAIKALFGDAEPVTCFITLHSNREQDAKTFGSINENRKPVSPVESFRISCEAKNVRDCAIRDMLDRYGLRVGTRGSMKGKDGTHVIGCIRLIQTMWRINARATEDTMSVLVQAFKYADGSWDGKLVGAVFAILSRNNGKVRLPRLIGVLSTKIPRAWLSYAVVAIQGERQIIAATHASSQGVSSAAWVIAGAMLKKYNHQLRNRLTI